MLRGDSRAAGRAPERRGRPSAREGRGGPVCLQAFPFLTVASTSLKITQARRGQEETPLSPEWSRGRRVEPGPEGAGRSRKPLPAERRGRRAGRGVPGRRAPAGTLRAASLWSCAPPAPFARPRSLAGSPARPSRARGRRAQRSRPPVGPAAAAVWLTSLRRAGGQAGGARRAEAAAALGREEADEGAERPRPGPRGEMASYVDNSFRQAVMKNPAERTPQVRPAGTWLDLCFAGCALSCPRPPFLTQLAPRTPLLPSGPPTFNGIPSPNLFPWSSWVYFSLSSIFFSLPSPLLTFLLRLAPRRREFSN